MNTTLRLRCGCGSGLGKPCQCGAGCRCGCCEGTQSLTPRPTANRPGLSALQTRIGTHASFLQSMKARLSSHALADTGGRPLAALRSRDGADPAITLLDGWATVADVLSFYQERIANEGYLRTATERRSLFELARLVGYRPRPGVAASVYLAYTVDANTPQEVEIPQGARVQSVPGPGELPQSFETSQPLRARAAWNKLGLRQSEPQQFDDVVESASLYLAGTQTRLKPGDPVLIGEQSPEAPAGGATPAVSVPPRPFRVLAVETDTQADRTRVRLEPWVPPPPPPAPPPGPAPAPRALGAAPTADELLAARLRRLVAPPSKPLPNALQLPRSLATSFEEIADPGLKVMGAVAPALQGNLAPALAGYEEASPPQPLRVWALRLQAGLFGRSAPRRTVTRTTRSGDVSTHTDVNTQADASVSSQTVDAGEWPLVGLESRGERGKVVYHEQPDTLCLDAAYNGIAPGSSSWVFVDMAAVGDYKKSQVTLKPVSPALVAPIVAVQPKVARADYGISGDTTVLQLGAPWLTHLVLKPSDLDSKDNLETRERDFQLIRRTTVYTQSELLPLAGRVIEDDLCSGVPGEETAADPIELDGLYTGLEAGRFVIVSGERSDIPATRGVFASEAAMITSVVHDVRANDGSRGPCTPTQRVKGGGDGTAQSPPAKLPGDQTHTFIWLDKPLAYCYRRASVSILANVVKATHGETRHETLGSGDGAKPLQRFDLKQAPLTHVAAATAVGAESTLQVHVNDVRWREVPGFVDQAPTGTVYTVQTDDLGKSTVQFGNGREGARPPTGAGNIKATYRNGLGRAGNVAAQQIQLLATRPLGIKEVVNPLRASGGADPESRDQVRRNAPLAVKALDRLVSTDDYADFACSFAGIGKADAVEISDGRRSVVHLTVAGADDIPLDDDSDLMIHLRRALRELGDPFQPLAVAPRELRLLIAGARLRIEADRLWEPVVTQVRSALLAAFGFERRELGQGVASSELLSVIQAVPGVAWVDLDAFGAIDTVVADADGTRPRTPAATAAAVSAVIAAGVVPAVSASRARREPGSLALQPAQLLLLSPDVPETLVLNQLR